tara:strand:- start:1497 stop:2936 length:1440 start_codon:yes stop_codon:yes gene_type:complete
MRVLRSATTATRRAAPRLSSTAALGFAALGISPALGPAVARLGFTDPTPVQQQTFAKAIDGKDLVVLAETGSGKTLAYSLPIVQMMLREAAERDAALDEDGAEPPPERPQALLLQPNRELCSQARGVLDGLVRDLDVSVSSLVDDDADCDADLLISTPAVALRAWRGPENIRWLVLDEADMLLAGSFKPAARSQYPIEQIIAAMKRDGQLQASAEGAGRVAGHLRGDERRLQKAALYQRSKQFLLVGATMPNAGTRNIENYVTRAFPGAEWVRTDGAHRKRDGLRQFFVKVAPAQRDAALRHAVVHGPPGRALVFANTLASAEDAHAALLEGVGELAPPPSGLFHKDVPREERTALLQAFAAGDVQVLVCTGLASRGIDFADVAHVVQYDMASNAVEFMHRIGRTARAGKPGATTCLYSDGPQGDLAETLRDAVEQGKPIDHVFSRKRSFRKGVKRYGRPGLSQVQKQARNPRGRSAPE